MDKAKRKQTILIVVFLIVILITGYLVYSTFFSKKPHSVSAPFGITEEGGATATAPSPATSSQNIPSSKLNTDLLTDPRFSQLMIFGDVPIEVGPVGRDNPFVPYEGYKSGGTTGP